MKSVKLIGSVLCLVLLTACAAKQNLPTAGMQVELVKTQGSIPVLSEDETGKVLPYVASENPYLLQRSQIDKGSVLLFIEAKKALRNKQLNVAKQKLGVITQKDESLSGPWVMLAEIAVLEKDYPLAQTQLLKAIGINKENVNAYTALASVQRLMGEFNVAQNTLALALQIWPDFPEAHLNLSILYDLYLNDPKSAQQHMEAYVFLNGNKNAQSAQWLAEIQGRTGITTSFIKVAKKTPTAQNDTAKETK